MQMNRKRSLFRNASGIAAVELALVMPPLLIIGLGTTEIVNSITTRKRVAELAMMVSDNASRISDGSSLNGAPIRESDINDVFLGAQLQSAGFNLEANGKVVLYSLEQNAQGGQWVRWRRCFGRSSYAPAYQENVGKTGKGFAGMSSNGQLITAAKGDSVMFVEIAYDYKPVIPVAWAGFNSERITVRVAMNVRDKRDLTGITPDAVASKCGT
jgi:hypothetical protein